MGFTRRDSRLQPEILKGPAAMSFMRDRMNIEDAQLLRQPSFAEGFPVRCELLGSNGIFPAGV